MKSITTEQKTYLLLGLFIAALLTANFLGGKIVSFVPAEWIATVLNVIFWPIFFVINLFAAAISSAGIFTNSFLSYQFFNTISVSVGILTVPIMFLITDAIEEVFGKEKAHLFVNTAVPVIIFSLVITTLAVHLPADPARQYFATEEYGKIFGTTIRMSIASIAAFILAQYHDIWAFNFWKKVTLGKWLWLRNNASTIVSQFIDSTVFMFIAFYGLSPRFTAAYIFSLIIPYWIFKILFALLDTPFCYALVKWLKK